MSSTPSIERIQREQQSGNQLVFLLNAVSRWWWAIIIFTIIGSVAFGLWGFIRFQTPELYRATAKLRVISTMVDLDYLQQVQGPQLVALNPTRLEARLRDDTSWATDVVRARVQQDLSTGAGSTGILTSEEDIQAEANRILSKVSFVTSQRANSDALTIQVSDYDREEAARIAEATARVIIERNRQYIMEKEQDTHDILRTEVDELRHRLDEAESEAWESRREMGFRTHEQVLADMQRMNQQLVHAEAQKSEIWAKMDEIEAELDQRDEDLPLALGRITDSVVTNLHHDLEKLLQEQLEMSIVYQPEYPGMIEIQDEIDEKRAAILVALDKTDTETGSRNTWQEHIDMRTDYRQLQLELSSLDIRTKTIKRLLVELVDKLPELSDKSFAHRQLERRKEHLSKQFDRWLDKMLEAQTAAQRGASQIERIGSVQVISAVSERSPFRIWFNFVIGAAAGLGIGIGFASFLEWQNTEIRGPEDITEYLRMDVIGTIPEMQFGRAGARPRDRRRRRFVVPADEDAVDASIVTKHDPKSPISEAYRQLRTRFQFATIKDKPRTVAVTSALPAEGKTTTAVNTAVTMADSGLRVLIMDTDLRRPNVHRVLKMERGTGLADVLREGLDVRSVIRPTRIENLWMISSGQVPPNPSELIGSERMRRVMTQLGESFDIVFCDAPSLLAVTDPLLLSSQVDTTLLVVAAGRARRETVARAKELLETADANVAGVVLNALLVSRRNYPYYYQYYESKHKKSWLW